MAEVVSTIMPAGGGDYTTLQAWEDWADGEANAQQTAECYSGGDLGPITFAGWASTASSTEHPKITVPLAERHGGSFSTGAYIDEQSSSVIYLDFDANLPAYLEIEHLRILTAGNSAYAIWFSNEFISVASSITVRNCLFWGLYGCFIMAVSPTGAAMTATFENNIFRETEHGIFLNSITAKGGIGNLTAAVYNCTIDGTEGPPGHYGVQMLEIGGATFNVAVKNTVAEGLSAGGFAVTGGSPSITASNNASSDNTADDWGGSGHLVGLDPDDLFTDHDNGDFTLKNGSALIDAGADLSGSFTDDIAGNTRPSGDAFDIGAFEYLAPLEINVLDDATPVADGGSIDLGSVTVDDTLTKTLTIQNTGGLPLTLDSAAFSGVDADKFSIANDSEWDGDADEEVAGGADTSLKIEVDTSEAGTYEATLTITSDDADEGTYEIDLTVTVSTPAEINVKDGETSVADGETTPIDFGSALEGS